MTSYGKELARADKVMWMNTPHLSKSHRGIKASKFSGKNHKESQLGGMAQKGGGCGAITAF